MPLISNSGLIADPWLRLGDGEAPPHAGSLLLSLSRLKAEWETLARRNAPLGVEIANTVRMEALIPHLARLSLIAIQFPAFTDGRGFSLARQLRLRGYGGRLRAVGPVIADQFRHAIGVGFDEIELSDAMAARQPAQDWHYMLTIVSCGYQLGYGPRATILERRRAARLPREAAE